MKKSLSFAWEAFFISKNSLSLYKYYNMEENIFVDIINIFSGVLICFCVALVGTISAILIYKRIKK